MGKALILWQRIASMSVPTEFHTRTQPELAVKVVNNRKKLPG